MVKWDQIGTSVENVPFEVAPGVNVWAQKWRDVLGVKQLRGQSPISVILL